MKMIPLSEAKSRLGHYGRMCRKQAVVVTVKGVPSFRIVPLESDEDDGLIDRLIAKNKKFQALLRKRKNEPEVSATDIMRRL